MRINASGDTVPKYRLNHDQSFPGPSGFSVNSTFDKSMLPLIRYGFCLKRIIHCILRLRQRHPEAKIFINKFDYDAAYMRFHMFAQSAQESLTIHDSFFLMALHLMFRGSACPNSLNCLSESGTDLANMIIQNPYRNHTKLFDPHSSQSASPESLPNDISFARTKALAVKIPTNDLGKQISTEMIL